MTREMISSCGRDGVLLRSSFMRRTEPLTRTSAVISGTS